MSPGLVLIFLIIAEIAKIAKCVNMPPEEDSLTIMSSGLVLIFFFRNEG